MSFMTSTCDSMMFSDATLFPTPATPGFMGAEKPACNDLENGMNPFGELVSLVKEHDALIADLTNLRVKLTRAAPYLECEGSRFALGKAYYDRLKMKHSTILGQLRDNRLRARRFLQKLDGDANES